MAPGLSPRKVVPLATGDERGPRSRANSAGTSITKRVFFCGIVVENAESDQEIPLDVQDLLASLGEPLDSDGSDSQPLQPETDYNANTAQAATRRRAMTNSSALADIIKELVTTERSYVHRLKMLKNDYADPLRSFARNKDTSIIASYEAKTLFGNIDALVPVNEAFLEDLEKMAQPGGPGIGDVALKHFKVLRGFENYRQYYSKREEAQAIFEKEIKKSSGFASFIDRIKYSSTDSKNRVGLRELLMEPVQRIPRYTLMFRTMMKHMAPGDPQRIALLEADDIASRIALAETDEQTKRAATMYCLRSSIEDFPPALISHARRFVDAIDVEDVLSDGAPTHALSHNTAGQAGSNLHCSLVLFDDKLMIVKRPNGERGFKSLAGFDDLDKVAKGGVHALNMGSKKSVMSCKGVLDVTDVVATDVGGPDMHLYLENPPVDQIERWSGRPFRAFSVVTPPSPINLNPVRTEAAKKRFLNHLWDVQARYRTRAGQSVAIRTDETEVGNRGGKITFARTYFNVYQRTAFLQEPKKTKIVLHVDPDGTADPIPFGIRGPPFVIVRVQPMAGDLSRYMVTSNDPNDEDEEDIVQTARIPNRIVQTIHQFGLFKFQTGQMSRPGTPTATSSRSKAAIFGLDAISRNIFSVRSGAGVGDFFGSTNAHRRSRTMASRTSAYTDTTTTGDSTLTRFSRSNSSITAATTISSMEDDKSISMSTTSGKSISRTRKLVRRGRSPGSESESDTSPRRGGSSRAPSASETTSRDRRLYSSDYEGEEAHISGVMDESERDLAMRLELARQNSQNQHEQQFAPFPTEEPVEDVLSDDDLSYLARPLSRISLSGDQPERVSQRSTTPRPDSLTPTGASSPDISPRRARSTSRNSSDRRPRGPRTPSPLPPPRSPLLATDDLPQEFDTTLETTLVNLGHSSASPVKTSPLPRSRRQPFEPTGNTNTVEKGDTSRPPSIVEPLSIKKKASVRSNEPVSGGRKINSIFRNPPDWMSHASSSRKASHSRTSRIPVFQSHTTHTIPPTQPTQNFLEIVDVCMTTKEDVESARRAVKRIKLEVEKLRSLTPDLGSTDEFERPSSPLKGLRSPQRSTPPITKEAQARMEEMRNLIGRRYGDGASRSRPLSTIDTSSLTRLPDSSSRVQDRVQDIARTVDELASSADHDLTQALKKQETIQSDVTALATTLQDCTLSLDQTKFELQNTKRQRDLMKNLLADCTEEKEIMYDAFNEELDEMYKDVTLPEGEAWTAVIEDLKETKEHRNSLAKENSHLKRRLAETELKMEEWAAILRSHGLIP